MFSRPAYRRMPPCGYDGKISLLGVFVISAAMMLTTVLLFRIIIMSGLTYMPVTDLNHITQGVLVIYIFLAALVNVIGYTN